MTVKIIHTKMPSLREAFDAVAMNFPNGFRYPEHAVKVHAYVENAKIIDSGTPVDIHVAGYGVVSFRFTPTESRPQAGASRGTFTPFKEQS